MSKAFTEADLISIIAAFEDISGLKGITTNVRKEAKL